MVALVTGFARFLGKPGTARAAVAADYGTIAWDPEDTEETELFSTYSLAGSPGAVHGTPAIARGTTFAVLGGAGRTDSSGVTLGTDGTLTYAGRNARPMVCLAHLTLAHAGYPLPGAGQLLVTKTLGLHLYRAGAPVVGADVYHDVSNLTNADQVGGGLRGFGLFSLAAVVEFKVGDVAQLRVSNQSDSSPVTVIAGTFTLHSL